MGNQIDNIPTHQWRRRDLRGSLRLESGRTWICRYPDENGREQRLIVGVKTDFTTKEAARREADRLMATINPALSNNRRSVAVAAFARIYESDAIALMKPSAAKAARSLLNSHICRVLGHLRLEEADGRWPQTLVNSMHGQHLANSTISNCLTIWSRMLLLARRYRYPCVDFKRSMIKMPAPTVRTPRRCYTPAESTTIIQAADWPWSIMFALLAHLGIRPGEVLGLKWPHINFQHRVIHIRENAVAGQLQTVKSARSRSDLPMSEPIARMLTQYRMDWDANALGLLFARADGQAWHGDYIRKVILTPLLKRLALPHGGMHAWRHGAVTALLNEGMALSVVQSIARHTRITTTQDYTHVVVDDQRRALGRLSELLPAPIGETRRTDNTNTQEIPA